MTDKIDNENQAEEVYLILSDKAVNTAIRMYCAVRFNASVKDIDVIAGRKGNGLRAEVTLDMNDFDFDLVVDDQLIETLVKRNLIPEQETSQKRSEDVSNFNDTVTPSEEKSSHKASEDVETMEEAKEVEEVEETSSEIEPESDESEFFESSDTEEAEPVKDNQDNLEFDFDSSSDTSETNSTPEVKENKEDNDEEDLFAML